MRDKSFVPGRLGTQTTKPKKISKNVRRRLPGSVTAVPNHTSDQGILDVVGVGAVNLDLVVTGDSVPLGAAAARARLEELLAVPGGVEWGAEVFVDEATVLAAVGAVGAASLTATLGGSAFNTVHALARLGRGLRLGYVGVAGQPPVPGLSSLVLLDGLGVDRSFVRSEPGVCGLCFSFAADGDRTMITTAGANAGLADLIDARFDALVGYLSRARVVHVAAPLDDRSPERLVALLLAVRATGSRALFSVDPGHGWATGAAPAVRDLIRASDLVLVNQREFTALGGSGPDASVAGRIAAGSATGRLAIVVKRPDGVLCCQQSAGGIDLRPVNGTPLPTEEIRDPTGAGDLFAAGLLAGLVVDDFPAGARLGLALARHSMRYPGTADPGGLAALAGAVLPAAP
jgi:sugar/nucleoside kinase (ribokinase family)